ncbi:MAG: hypothetical protein RSE06_15325, partial [Comamonas sp.]
SRNDKISVQSQYTPPPANTRWNGQNGLIAWELQLPASSSAHFKAVHQIRFPEDMAVTGLQ